MVIKSQEVKFFGENVTFDHIGLVVESIDKVAPDVKPVTYPEPAQQVTVAFICLHGLNLELIEPMGENSPVSLSLKKGQKLVHLCYRTPDLAKSIEESKKHGFFCFKEPLPSKTYGGKMSAWLFSRTYGLFELIEE